MRKKDLLSFAFETFFKRTWTNAGGRKLTKVDYLRQTNRLYANVEIASLKYLFDKYQFDYVLDIGANQGQFYQYIRNSVGYTGKIISVEPSPMDFKQLEESGKNDSNFKALQVACGEVEGIAKLRIARDSKLNSFYHDSEYAKERFSGKIKVSEEVEVRVQTLEGILNSLNLDSEQVRLLVKVDTQGHDLPVIKGLGKWTKNVYAIETELSLLSIYENIVSYVDAIKYFEGIGFNLFSCSPVLRDKRDNSIIELNGFFVRRESGKQ